MRARFIVTLLLIIAAGGAARAQTSDSTYQPLRGFRLIDTPQGTLNFKLYAYARYLNQLGLDDEYTDSFGNTSVVKRRQDVQFQKVLIYFLGWFLDPRFRYLTYIWTTNTSLGRGAQVVVAGNLSFRVDKHLTIGGGINALPGVRSLDGNFPLWLSSDNRLIADEFFRPSYTSGIWIKGEIAKGLSYQTMLGNNLSQLGVDAGQLNNRLDTWSSSLVWLPTTGEFGPLDTFGDFQSHEKLATRVGVHFSRSDEDAQEQPNTDAFENVQLRLSDGNPIFVPNLFGQGVRVTDARYRMTSIDAGAKYHGMSLEGEYYWRRLDHFRGPGTSAVPTILDHGFQLQASAMVLPKRLQAYASGSKVFGDHGNPWDTRAGTNWYPFERQIVRLNLEYLRLHRSPVGALSLPYPVGGNGYVIYSSLEVTF